jgi:hypothetical protein
MKKGGDKHSEYFKLVHSTDHIVQRARWGHRLSDICDDVMKHTDPLYAKINEACVSPVHERRNAITSSGASLPLPSLSHRVTS